MGHVNLSVLSLGLAMSGEMVTLQAIERCRRFPFTLNYVGEIDIVVAGSALVVPSPIGLRWSYVV